MLPPVGRGFVPKGWWAGFSSCGVPTGQPGKFPGYVFLDYEYIYNPADFRMLEGGKWHPVRKNLRWAIADAAPLHLLPTYPLEAVSAFVMSSIAQDSEWQDPEVMVKYLLFGEHRLFVVDAENKLLGILAWDENWAYVNFRYCLVAPGVRGLSDLARVWFYWYIDNLRPGKLVNDGGSLDDEGLRRYKLRLNPCKVNKIYSYGGV